MGESLGPSVWSETKLEKSAMGEEWLQGESKLSIQMGMGEIEEGDLYFPFLLSHKGGGIHY